MFNGVRTFFLIFSFFAFSILAYSQDNGLLIEQSLDIKIPFTITQFSTKSGLPQSRVIEIISKGNGNLIIATANGIVEYDGNEFSSFIEGDEYKSFEYTKLMWHEKSGRLFAVTGGQGIKLLYPNFKHVGNFKAACLEKDSLFCINFKGEIFSAHVKSLNFKKRLETKITNAKCIIVYSNAFLIGNKNSLCSIDPTTGRSKEIVNGNFFGFKKNTYDQSVFALTTDRVFKIYKGQLSLLLDIKTSNATASIMDVDFIDPNKCYVSTTNGLYEIAPSHTHLYTRANAFPSVYLLALQYNSKENCLFVGTGEKGMLRLQFKNCYSFTPRQGFAEASSLSSIVRNSSGKVLVANSYGHIYQVNADTVIKQIELNVGCASLSMVDDLLYVGTWQMGVLILKDKLITDSITYPAQLPSASVHGAFKDSRGNIWIGTYKGIAMGTKPGNIRTFLEKEIKHVTICFYELKNKNICIGGSDGVFILNHENKIVTHLGKKEGLACKEVRSFYEDEQGKLWIGTYDGGLYCYYNKRLTSINQLKNSKLDRDAFCLAKDKFGYIYSTSNHGLWRISEKKLSLFHEGKLDYLIPYYYGEETGIVNTEFNGGFQSNFLNTGKNQFYFPSIEGVVVVNPEETSFRKLYPRIDKIYVNDTLHDFKNTVLNDKTFSIGFDFSCLSYLSKYNLYFQYKLESAKKSDWSSLQKNSSVNFKMLPAGQYTFSVRAIDALNDENPSVATYSFFIKPVFYDTIWFKTLAFILFVALASTIIRMRVKRFRKEAEEKERVRRQLAEFELKATHAQMNPHFIFNSLNSIKYYLSINDQKNADNYIDHFSSLLRSFLENGSKDFISLKTEIHILTSYLELEKQRMNPPFTFTLSSEPLIQLLLIPTHIVQPFVENAIKHGINHSEKKCHLDVRFYKQDNHLICEVEDDGIGRERSGKINQSRGEHNSKGLEMVKEKIRIVKEIYKFEILLNIHDKMDEQLRSTGTKVQIKIPIHADENSHS